MARLSTFLALAAAVVAPSARAQPKPIFSNIATGITHSAGTGVKASPDGAKVYATADDGTLVIANAADGSALEKKKPAGAVACNTGVSFSPDGTEVMYAVWTNAGGATSQINAYSVADNSPTWSFDVNGTLAGAPMYGKDGAKVYFTWNDSEGHFSALSIDGATATEEFTQSLSDIDVGPPKGVNMTLITSELTWSGVDVAIDPDRVQEIDDDMGEPTGKYEIVPGGNYRFGEGNTNDLVVWAHLSPDGQGKIVSYYYVYQAPILPTDAHEVIALDESGWAVLRRPVLSSNGIRMLVAAQKGLNRGWTEPALLSQGADVKLNIKQGQRDGPNPSLSTPSFTPDDKLAFFASTVNAVYGMRADQASVVNETTDCETCDWEKIVQSAVVAGTQTDDEYVYAAASSGFMHKLNALTGVFDDGWTEFGVSVGSSISADFDVVKGNMYYVTEAGALNAWNVGAAQVPETSVPTGMPTAMPAAATTTMIPPEDSMAPTMAPNMTTTMAPNVTTTMAPNVTTTMAPNVTTTMTPNVTTTMTPNVTTTMTPNVTTTMAPDVTTTMVPNVTTTMAPDVTTTTAPDVTTTMAPDVTTTMAPDMTTTTTSTTSGESPTTEPPTATPSASPSISMEPTDSSAGSTSVGLATLLGALALMVL